MMGHREKKNVSLSSAKDSTQSLWLRVIISWKILKTMLAYFHYGLLFDWCVMGTVLT